MPIGTSENIDKYIVLGKLGKGAKSTIWKVQDSETGQLYTLKQVIKESEDDNRFFDQAKTEFNVSSRLDHPYLRKSFVLKRIRKWLKTQELILVMEYIEGEQLNMLKPHEIEPAINIFTQVAEGLKSLHDSGFVHADIKPKNILIVPNDGLKIIDFGQSCPIGHKKTRIQGTPDYMAPEQKERGFLDQRTDVFSLGASLYWILTGKKFPTSMSSGSTANDLALFRDIPKPDALNPDVPPSLSKLIMDCCNTGPKDRPENMTEVIARLDLSRHLYKKQAPQSQPQPQPEPEKEIKIEEPKKHHRRKPEPEDDSDDFEKFLETIL